MISERQIWIEAEDHIVEISVVQLPFKETVIFRLVVQVAISFQKPVPFLEKIVFGTSIYTLIHDIDTKTCEGIRQMFDHMKRICGNAAVREVFQSYILIGLPEIDCDVSDAFPFFCRDLFEISGKSALGAVGKDVTERPVDVVDKDGKIRATILCHLGMKLIDAKAHRKSVPWHDKKAVGI
jgi:hypothetical protein